MHVYSNGVETVSAEDMWDAEKVWEHEIGDTYNRDEQGLFEQLDDDKELTIHFEEHQDIPGRVPFEAITKNETLKKWTVSMTNKAWTQALGRGLVGSTEF